MKTFLTGNLAGLSRDVPTAFERGGIYVDDDETISNAAWDAIEYYHGTVALEHDYAASKGLPRSQNFPWDDTKGIYFLNGFHNLHCVVSTASIPNIAHWRVKIL